LEEQNYETIIVAAEHAQLKKIHDVFAVENTVNTLLCRFAFRSDEWDWMTKTAVFIKEGTECFGVIENKNPIHVLLDETGVCEVPQEVLEDQGYFSVGVFGINGDAILPTNLIRFKCHAGCYSDGTAPSSPTQSIYEQILTSLSQKQNKSSLETDVKSFIDKNYIKSLISEELNNANFSVDRTLIFSNGVLSVNTTNKVESDNTLPITSAAVDATIGNIEILLNTI